MTLLLALALAAPAHAAPTEFEVLRGHAAAAVQADDLLGAVQAYMFAGLAFKDGVDDPVARMTNEIELGAVFEKLKLWDKAAERYGYAYQLAPDAERKPGPLLLRAKANVRLREYAAAVEDARAYVKARPDEAWGRLVLGVALARTPVKKEAREALKASMERVIKHPRDSGVMALCRRNLAWLDGAQEDADFTAFGGL